MRAIRHMLGALVLCSIVAAPPIAHTHVTFVGPETQVNSFELYQQRRPGIAIGSESMLAVWCCHSFQAGGDPDDVIGRLLTLDGEPFGDQYRLNDYTPEDQSPSGGSLGTPVAALADGSFVVAWHSQEQDGSPLSIFARIFDSEGSALGPEFPVAADSADGQSSASIAATSSGGFVVTWTTLAGLTQPRVAARVFSAGGTPLTGDIEAKTLIDGYQSRPKVDVLANGDIVIGWREQVTGNAWTSALVRVFDPLGTPRGAAIDVSAVASENERGFALSALSDGNFAVTFSKVDAGMTDLDFFVRKFSSAGVPLTGDMSVGAGPGLTSSDNFPVAAGPDGGFAIAYQQGIDDVFVRRFDSAATPIGTAVRANATFPVRDGDLSLESNGSGEFALVWQGDAGNPVSLRDVFLQRFELAQCGSGLKESGEDCDDGNLADGDGCSATCSCEDTIDDDGDGVANGCDPCTNVGGSQSFAEGTRLKLKRINREFVEGNDQLSLRAQAALPAGATFAALDPLAAPIRIVLAAAEDPYRVDTSIPNVAYSSEQGYGWRSLGGSSKWLFVDKTGIEANGLRKILIKDRGDGVISLSLRGKDGSYPIVTLDPPVQVMVDFGGASAGLCGEVAFADSECKFDRSQRTLKCKG